MDGIAESDVAIEVSTAGLRKPVGEIYPAPRVPRDVPRGRPAGGAVVSDAHVPEQLGYEYDARVELLRRRSGVSEIAVFERPRAPAWSRSDERRARAGIGYDSHRFADGRPLVLGGVEIPGARGPRRPLRRRRAHARRDRRPAGRGRRSATSASTSRTPTSAGATPTASSCCARSAPSLERARLAASARRRDA